MTAVELVAPAKLTLSLRVTGVRSDGFHLIDAEMISLDFADMLLVSPSESSTVVLHADSSVALEDVGGPDDLIIRALESAGLTAEVELVKHIPPGAGLGGGSADAAAILRWARHTALGDAAQLGADVPFCIVGGRARVTGIGEVIESLPPLGRSFTVVTPPVHCSTPAVYAMWDELGGPVGANGNDLEPAALAVAPELAAVRDALGEATGLVPRLAGSGSSWFVEGAHPEAGRVVTEIASQVRDRPPW